VVSEAILAYAAGIIDGEGSIYVGKTLESYALNVEVKMTDREPVEFLGEHFGGLFRVKETTSNGRQIYCWHVRQNKAVEFLKLIQPYVLGKADQLEVAILFPLPIIDGVRVHKTGNGSKLPEYVVLIRKTIYEKLKALKVQDNNKKEEI